MSPRGFAPNAAPPRRCGRRLAAEVISAALTKVDGGGRVATDRARHFPVAWCIPCRRAQSGPRGRHTRERGTLSDKEIITCIWALVGAVAAIAAARLDWPTSLLFFALGVGALVMAVRTERS